MNKKADPLIEFFLNPLNYSEKVESIKHIETHISHVFIAGNYVYKIKKPVNFGFLDFTTLKKRRFYCYREVELNSRLSKDLYIGVLPIYSFDKGFSFQRKAGSKIIEYAIKMNRIDDNTILFKKIQDGCVLNNQIEKVVKHIAMFHKNIPPYTGKMSIFQNTKFSCEENFQQIWPYLGITFEEHIYQKLVNYTRKFLKEKKTIFYQRKKKGFIKEIHGDLHSQHISLLNPPVIFDCIEFNKRFRIDDVLNDIAFLIMDLEYNGRFDLAKAVQKVYEECYKEAIDQEFIQFYKIYRAVVRGKVEGFIADTVIDKEKKQRVIKKARDYFNLAETYLNQDFQFNPVIFFGPSGSGKSTIAKEFSNHYEIIRSDEIRKKISGKPIESHTYVGFGEDIYNPDMTTRTYNKMMEIMLEYVQAGKKVILDATFLKKWQREMVIKACEDKGLKPFFIYFFAPEDLLFKRIRERKREGKDISDAHEEILKRQLIEQDQPNELKSFELMKINTNARKEDIIESLRFFL